jgi:hypothetical protein
MALSEIDYEYAHTQMKFLGVNLTKWGSDRIFNYMLKNNISGNDDAVSYIIKFLSGPESIGYREKYSKNVMLFGLDNCFIEEQSSTWKNLFQYIDYEEKSEKIYIKEDMQRVYQMFIKKYPNKSHKEFGTYLVANCNFTSEKKKYLYAIGLCNLYKLLPKNKISQTLKSELNRLLIFAIDRTEHYRS